MVKMLKKPALNIAFNSVLLVKNHSYLLAKTAQHAAPTDQQSALLFHSAIDRAPNLPRRHLNPPLPVLLDFGQRARQSSPEAVQVRVIALWHSARQAGLAPHFYLDCHTGHPSRLPCTGLRVICSESHDGSVTALAKTHTQ